MSFFDLYGRIHGKKLVLFGAAARGRELAKSRGLAVSYFVDNDSTKQGTEVEGLPVRCPDCLRKEKKGAVAIVITSVEYADTIIQQLATMGFAEGEDCWVDPDAGVYTAVGRMRRHPADLLVTCFGVGGGLYRVRLPEGRCTRLVEGSFRGFCRIGETYVLAEEKWGLRQFDKQFREVDAVEGLGEGVRKLHGVAFHGGSSRLYVTETHRGCLGIYTLNPLRRVGEWRFRDSRADEHALNDLWIEGDALYLSMHSYSGHWRRGVWDGVTVHVDIGSERIVDVVLRGHEQPHSLQVIDGGFHYCNSFRCELRRNADLVATFPGYTRGLAWDGRYFYIGQSEMKHLDRVAASNTSIDCGVHVYDPVNRISRFIPVPAIYIYGIRVLARGPEQNGLA